MPNQMPFFQQLHFPILKPNHWVLACVNPLFSSINFFDSAGVTSKYNEDELTNNLVLSVISFIIVLFSCFITSFLSIFPFLFKLICR